MRPGWPKQLPHARVSLVQDSYRLIPLDQPQLLADLIADHVRDTANN